MTEPLAEPLPGAPPADSPEVAGVLRAGTSGFAYRPWAPAFYPPGLPAAEMLAFYAQRLPVVELNSTYYQHPSPARIASWLAETPPGFRFAVKAHRFASRRAFASDPDGTVPWLSERFRPFGERLAAVLLRVPLGIARDDERLERFAAAWPPELPLALEFEEASWQAPQVHDRLRAAGIALCLTDREGAEEPPIVAPGPFAYLRLRRESYGREGLEAWAARIAALLDEGRDAYVFFRHDPTGQAPAGALGLARAVAARRRSGIASGA